MSITTITTIKGDFLNHTINALPIELHISGYQFCDLGTHLEKRLARGDRGINSLNAVCHEFSLFAEQRSHE